MLYCGISVSFNPLQLFDLTTANELFPVLIHHVLHIHKVCKSSVRRPTINIIFAYTILEDSAKFWWQNLSGSLNMKFCLYCLDDFCWSVEPCRNYMANNPVWSLVEPQLKHIIYDKSFEGNNISSLREKRLIPGNFYCSSILTCNFL